MDDAIKFARNLVYSTGHSLEILLNGFVIRLEEKERQRRREGGHMVTLLFFFSVVKSGKLHRRALPMKDAMIRHGISLNKLTYSVMIDSCVKKHNMDHAMKLLQEMRGAEIAPDIEMFTSVMNGLVKKGKMQQALEVNTWMEEEGLLPTAQTYNMLLSGYASSGDMEQALELVKTMQAKGVIPDVPTLMHGFLRQGNMDKALEVNALMEVEGVFPSALTFDVLLNGNTGDMSQAWELKKKMQAAHPGAYSYNTMMHGLASKGDMNQAMQLLDEMKRMNIKPNEITFTTLIRGYATQHKWEKVEKVFSLMQEEGVCPGMDIDTILRDANIISIYNSRTVNQIINALSAAHESHRKAKMYSHY